MTNIVMTIALLVPQIKQKHSKGYQQLRKVRLRRDRTACAVRGINCLCDTRRDMCLLSLRWRGQHVSAGTCYCLTHMLGWTDLDLKMMSYVVSGSGKNVVDFIEKTI